MSNPKFKWYFRVANGSDYDYKYVDTSGAVTFTTSSTPVNNIRYAPEGWQDMFLMWERGFQYYALMRKHSLGLRFTNDGAKILRNEYYTNGIQNNLEVYVEKFDSETYTYGAYFKGGVQYNGSLDQYDFVQVELAEAGFFQKLEANDSTNFEIAVDGNASKIWVKLHTMYLHLLQKWIGSQSEVVSKDLVGNGFPIFAPLEAEGTNIYYGVYTQSVLSPQKLIQNASSSSKTFEFTYYYDYNVYIPSILGAVNGIFEIGYFLFDDTNTFVSETILYHHTSTLVVGASANYVGTETDTITLSAGYWVSAFVRMYPAAAAPGLGIGVQQAEITQDTSYILVQDDQATEEGYFPALYWRDVTGSLINQMNGSSVTLSSAVFSEYPNWVLSPGDAIRNLPSSFLKTNFADDFASINAKAGAAFRYDADTNTAYLDKKADVFQDVEILDLGEVAEFSQEPFTQEMFSTVKIGQTNQTYDEVNGKDEAHTEVTRTTPLNAVPAEKNMKSVYRSDPMGVLMTFLNLNGKTVTDADSDNDVFILHIGSSVAGTIPTGYPGAGEDYYDLYIDPTWSVTNVYRGDVLFNIELAPLVSFMRSGDYVHGLMYGQDSSFIEWRSSAKSNSAGTKMQYTIGSVTYDEGADILISDLADPLIKPMVATVKTKVPVDLYSTLATNAYGWVKYTWLDDLYKGFILKASQQPTTEEAQQFKLLLTASTDVSNLIR